MLVTSRSYDEYAAMFALDPQTLTGARVLDCSAGASNFVARVRRAGGSAVAVDPAYAMGRDRLADTAAESNRSGHGIAAAHTDRFTWSWYGSREARERMRAGALAEFVLDVTTHPQHYVAAALPHLPFADRTFDLAVCSHLLFTWADQLGRPWHAAALAELSRVAAEVRVFPTVVQGRGEPVPFWDDLMADLRAAGAEPQLRPVPYEFQIGADAMLVVSSGGAAHG